MDLFAYEPLLTTDGIRPVPKAVVGFYAVGDTTYSAPLEVFDMEGKSLGFSMIADEHGYVNNAGGYKLAVREAVSKSGKLPAVPVYSVRSVVADANTAATAAEVSKTAAVTAAAKADQIPTLVTQATASNSTVVQAAAAAVDANPKITQLDTAVKGAVPKVGTRLTTEDLDTVTAPGKYFQPSTADATPERHYPFVSDNNRACLIEVESYNTNFVNRVQYALSMDGKMQATRSIFNNGAWTDWVYYRPYTTPTAVEDMGIHQHMMRLNDMQHRIGQPRTNGRAAVALVADHGTNNFNEIIVPLLRETGLRATIALNSQMYDPAMPRYKHDNRTTWATVKSWHDSLGVEIANHGRMHKDQTTVEAIRTEIVGGRQELEANLPGVNIDTYVQVGLSGTNGFLGHNNGTTLASYYTTDAGRIIIDSHALFTGTLPGPRTYALSGHPIQGVSSYWIDGGATAIAAAKQALEGAMAGGRGISIRFHPEVMNTESYTTTAQMQEFLRYLGNLAAQGQIVPLTLRELALASSAPDEATTRRLAALV